MNANVLFAVFKRNFVSYFANPTGYVFICVFVLLSGFAAFWPNDFFNANLANLDQLTRWFPFIMLIFIPAIAMSVWAQERAQGTDELLLTVPGSDLGIVTGKYLAAVAIFTVSLLFSLVCNFAVLAWLGEPDRGLFLGTYLGYWCVGLAMLAVGMVGSFLTGNLTIAFILAALLNAPLVFAVFADAVMPADAALAVKQWSYGAQLRDFSQGMVSFPGIAYFASIVAVALYLSTVFLGRRHWSSGHLDVPRWAAYPLVVLVWLVVAALLYGVLLLGDEVLAILIANFRGEFLDEVPWPPLWRLISMGGAVAAVVAFIAVRQGWSWFPDRVSWMVFHYAARTAALVIVAVCFNVLCQRQYHFFLDGLRWLDWVVLGAVAAWAAGIAAVVARGRNPWQFWALLPALVILPFTGALTAVLLALVAGAVAGIGWGMDKSAANKPAVAWLTLLVIVAAYALGVWAVDRYYFTEDPKRLQELGLERADVAALLGLLDVGVKLLCLAAGWRLLCGAFRVAPKTLALAVPGVALAACAYPFLVFAGSGAARIDVTSERLNSLSRPARELLAKMEFPRPVTIEAFVSPTVPESYVQTRMNLLSMLRQLEARLGKKVRVVVNETGRFSEEATRAQTLFGIEPRKVPASERGVRSDEDIFLGVAVKSGWRKVVVPFIGRGTPLEYELVRSLGTLAKPIPEEGEENETAGEGQTQVAESEAAETAGRKRLGVVPTGFRLLSDDHYARLLEELRKQYEVVEVKWDEPITAAQYDVLLAVQPSSLVEERPPMGMPPNLAKKPKTTHMDQLVAAIRSGVPTAIFQDPFPGLSPVPPPEPLPSMMTPEEQKEKMMRDMQMQMRGQPPPPDPPDYSKLWNALGVEVPHRDVVWQAYNPYPKIERFAEDKEFVFLDNACKAEFNKGDDVSRGLQRILFPFPGRLVKKSGSTATFTPLVATGPTKTGIIDLRKHMVPTSRGMDLDPQRVFPRKPDSYVLAARIEGSDPPVDAVLVADVDVLSPAFLHIREEERGLEEGIEFDLDNVTFVLNVLDSLARDYRFVDMRNHRPKHRPLVRVEQRTEKAKEAAAEARDRYQEECAESIREETESLQAKLLAIQKDLRSRKTIDPQQLSNDLGAAYGDFMRRQGEKQKELERVRDRKVAQSEMEYAHEVRRVQDRSKIWAVALPPIPPLIIAAIVFFTRRVREREGVARSRLR